MAGDVKKERSESARRAHGPRLAVGSLDSDSAAKLVTAASDIALVVDARGIVKDVAFASDELARLLGPDWVGRTWRDTVSSDSRNKVETMVEEAATHARPTWRQVNHPATRGDDIPVLYSVVRIADGRIVAIGRDLRAIATLQQRVVAAQQTMERDYARLRHAETRYRLLFQLAAEAVLIVDASTRKVLDANPAAQRLLANGSKQIIGRAFPGAFAFDPPQRLENLLSNVRAGGQPDEVRVKYAQATHEFIVSASLFRQEESASYLVRLATRSDRNGRELSGNKSTMLEVIERAPDGFVVTDIDGRILTTNQAFLDMAQLGSEEQARGEPLERWLGRASVDVGVLMANLKQHGSVRLFATTVRDDAGNAADVEVSAVSVMNGASPCLGFMIRGVGRRIETEPQQLQVLPRSVEQLTELVGRVSLKDLVRETTDVIERMCIEAALELTGDNRASAAEMLGLSRQSLYIKLRRYGLGDLDADPDAPE